MSKKPFVWFMMGWSVISAVLGVIAIFKPEMGSPLGYMGVSLGCSAHARVEALR